MREIEQDKKKLLLELNNNKSIKDGRDVNIFGNIKENDNNKKY